MNTENLSKQDVKNILSGATDVLVSDPRKIQITLDMPSAAWLVAQLQTAFRHPENTGPTRRAAENLVRDLINQIDPGKGDLYKLLMMGFDAQYDSEASDSSSNLEI